MAVLQDILQPFQQRIYDNLPSMLSGAPSKEHLQSKGQFPLLKEDAVLKFSRINYAQYTHQMIPLDFDCEYERSMATILDLPLSPNAYVENKENGHVQAYYNLKDAVWKKGKRNVLSFLKACREAATNQADGADPKHRNGVGYNIFNHPDYAVRVLHNGTVSLSEFSEYFELEKMYKDSPAVGRGLSPRDTNILKKNLATKVAEGIEASIGERNDFVFNASRFDCYPLVEINDFQQLFLHCYDICSRYNELFCNPSLSETEIAVIAKSIAGFTFRNEILKRNRLTFLQSNINRGRDKGDLPFDASLIEKQANSAVKTNDQRAEECLDLISKAFVDLRLRNFKRITQKMICNESGVSESFIKRNWSKFDGSGDTIQLIQEAYDGCITLGIKPTQKAVGTRSSLAERTIRTYWKDIIKTKTGKKVSGGDIQLSLPF